VRARTACRAPRTAHRGRRADDGAAHGVELVDAPDTTS
jgi:hypothetical protein